MIYKFTFLEKLLLRFNVIPHPLIDALINITAGRALQVGLKLGVFDNIEKDGSTLKEIAKRISVNEENLGVLMNSLNALGYIEKVNDDIYKLTERSVKFLLKDSLSSMRNLILFSDLNYEELLNLEKHIKHGWSENYLETFTAEQWDIFTNAMIEIANGNAPEIAKYIPKSKKYRKLLDLGGMHGAYAVECCRKMPLLSAEIIDFIETKPYADAMIKKHKMVDRIKFRAGDFMREDLGKEYDIILSINVIHGFTPESNNSLTNRIYEALNKDGIYVIVDLINQEKEVKSKLSQVFSSSMGLMLFNKAGGRTYSFQEICKWFIEAGFKNYSIKKMRIPGYNIIIAKK